MKTSLQILVCPFFLFTQCDTFVPQLVCKYYHKSDNKSLCALQLNDYLLIYIKLLYIELSYFLFMCSNIVTQVKYCFFQGISLMELRILKLPVITILKVLIAPQIKNLAIPMKTFSLLFLVPELTQCTLLFTSFVHVCLLCAIPMVFAEILAFSIVNLMIW